MTRVFWQKWGKALSGHREFNDLYHEGVIALIRCRTRWDPAKGASFWSYASHRVMGALVDHVREDPHIPVNRRSRQGDWLELQPLADLDGGDEDRCLNTEHQHPHDTKLLSTLLATLHARELEIIYLRYYEDITLTEIGNRLGVTEGRVHQLHDKIMAKLKKRLSYPAIVTTLSKDALVSKMIARRRRRNEQAQRQLDHSTAVVRGVRGDLKARSVRRDSRRRAASRLRAT